MKIAVSTVDFLGAVIGEGTIKLQPHIIKKIVNFNEEELKTKKGLRKIKEQVQNLPDLEIPPENAYIILETDGCMEGWGGIVKWKKSKEDPRSSERICAYASGKFSTNSITIECRSCYALTQCTGEMKELAAAAPYSVEEVSTSTLILSEELKTTGDEVEKISNDFLESSQKLSSHLKNQEHYTNVTSSRPIKPQSEWINLMHGDQSLKTLNFEQQKKQLKPCETYKQSYNAKLKI
ncbi:hypothetical protein Tco_1071167 [Tanacetum coccineum]|uniref:Reverse transcriptase/retrotransposon-derived protein RNase H-like domain-containing protein n=1 Tax=Tanacetum coccineum TaxID=301880 RepID=A0ABQ5HNK5_9ASTR